MILNRKRRAASNVRVAMLLAIACAAINSPAAVGDVDTLTLRDQKNAAMFEDILFRATFDGAVDADIFNGDPKGRIQGGTVFEEGRFGQALAVGEDFARVKYTVGSHGFPINLDCRQGAISFYFKAVDWDPGERWSHLFFRVDSLALLRIFTDAQGMLVFETGTDLAQKNAVRASIANLERGKWHHVVATWTQEQIALYVNGQLAARADNEDRFLSHASNTSFEIGDIPRGPGRPGTRKTLVDDLTIFRRPLAVDELFRVEPPRSSGTAPVYEPPTVVIPRAINGPLVDGRFAGNEWNVAAGLANFASVSDHKLAPVQTKAYVTYDSERLYVAVLSPVLPGQKLAANCTRRDDNVWQDDAVQVYLTAPSGDRYLFIGNAAGTIYDRKYEKGLKDDVTWNGNWQYGTSVANDVWTAEVAIAFADLGVEPPADGQTWRLNVTRDRVEPQNLSAWPALSQFADTAKHGILTFVGHGAVVSAAPDFDGTTADNVDLSVTIDGGALADPSTVQVQWIAAAAGKVLGTESKQFVVEPGANVIAAFRQAIGASPDALTFIVRDTTTDRVLYRQTCALSQAQGIALSFSAVPSRGVCKVNMKINDAGLSAMSPVAQIDVIPAGGGAPVASMRIDEISNGRGSAQFDLNELEPGDYDVRTQLVVYGRTVATQHDTFTKPHEPWRGTTLGLSDTPPPPWKPIRADTSNDGKLTVEYWNRRYVFDNAPVPTSIDNGGENVLAGPVRIDADIDGETQTWQAGKLTVVEQNNNKVVFETSQQSATLACTARTTTEFDGMLWTEVTLAPKPGEASNASVTIDRLDLVIPIKGRYAKYRHWPGDVPLTGNMGPDDGWRWSHALPKYAYLWLGDDDLGLTWFFETWGQFRFANENSTVELVRENGVLSLVIHYVGKPVVLDEPLTLAFGLQATPTRPRRKGWRSWGGGNTVGTNIDVSWTSEEQHRYGAGYPEAANLDYYRRFLNRTREQGGMAVPYNVILWSAEFSPEMKYNVADWDLGGGINKYSDHRRFWWGRRVCGAATSYAEFFTYKARNYLQSTGADGLYHDLQWSYRCGSMGHGYSESHRSIRGDRELNKRVYTMMKAFDRPLWKFDHASNFVCSVTSPFSDLFTTGEEMRRYPPDGDHENHRVRGNYFHEMRLDYFKACGATGRQWGVAPCLLTQITTNEDPRYTESLYAILVPHDAIPTWEALMRDIRYQRRVQQTFEEFDIGADDVAFLPYWHDTTPVQVAFTPDGGGPLRPFQVEYEIPEVNKLLPEEAIGASVYRRQGKRSLVAVFNYTHDDGVAKVTIDLSRLGLAPDRTLATDAFTRRSWVRADGEIEVAVKTLNYRLIWVEEFGANAHERAAIGSAFPAHLQEVKLAGYRPDFPRKESLGTLVAGDILADPSNHDDHWGAGPQRSELAQTFTLKKSARVHRVELYMTDSKGAFAIRKPAQISIIKLDGDGLPGDEVVVSAEAFAPIWADPRSWRYGRFDLHKSRVLDPGRYAIVITKHVEDPAEYFHVRFAAMDSSRLPGEYVMTREYATEISGASEWNKNIARVIGFGVYGFE